MVVTADDDQQLVVEVNRHMTAAHNSFELEEVVLDAASDAPDTANESDS
jgi:predicted small metal-binding protein